MIYFYDITKSTCKEWSHFAHVFVFYP